MLKRSLFVLLALLCFSALVSRAVHIGYYNDKPIVYQDENGEPAGLYADLLQYIAEEQGWELVWRYETFPVCMELLEKGEIDLMTAIAWTPDRQFRYNYNAEPLFINWGVVYLPKHSKVETISDLSFCRVSMMEEDAYAVAFNVLAESFELMVRPVYCESYQDAMRKASLGQAEGAVVNRIVGREFSDQFDLHASTIYFHPVPLRLAAPPGQCDDIFEIIDAYLADWRDNPSSFYFATLDRVMRGESLTAGDWMPLWLRWALSAVVFLFIGAVGMLLHMRRVSQRKTARLTEKEREIEFEKAYRKKAERESYESQVYYGDIIESMLEGFLITDTDHRITYANPSLAKMFGYPVQEMIGRSVFNLITSKDRNAIEAELEEIIHGKAMSYDLGMRTANGEEIRAIVSPKGIFTEGNIYRGLFVLVHDMTEIIRTRSELDLQRTYFQQLFQHAPEAIVIADADGRVMRVNPGFERMFGYSQKEAEGKEIDELIVPAEEGGDARRINEDALHRRSQVWERMRMNKTGELLDVSILAYPITISDTRVGLFAMYQDMTDRRKMERELLKTQKLEDLGLLAGGIAHDFNNILTAIIGNISLAKLYAHDAPEALERIENAEKASLQAKDLTYQLLTFAKGGEPIRRSTNLVKILRETSSFALSGSNVKCTLDAPDDLPTVNVDSGQISQVIQNLIINADQAMPEGGAIEIKAREVEILHGEHMHLESGRYLRLTLQDSGSGIPPELIERIFEPYFSTKETGSGLGLATTYSIMKKHGGHVEVESKIGVGSTFTLWLPVDAVVNKGEEKKVERKYGDRERILVMDDEQIVLDTVREFLEHLLYRVDCAMDGAEAVEKYMLAKESDPYAAVIIDVTIPGGMGGRECVKRLIEFDPDVKGIVSSGYSNDEVLAEYRKYGFVARLNKPYEIDDLGELLHKVLRSETR